MRIAILGAGFTGLTAAYRLLQKGHEVSIFEKEDALGGLAVGFSKPNWKWTLEKAYHHWFTNDYSALNLAKEINHKVIIKRPSTDIFIQGKRFAFDSAISLLQFPYLSIFDKLRMGSSLAYLKLSGNHKKFEGKLAYPWIKKYMGENAFNLIWDPLLTGKFGTHKNNIALTWFWARIKKRTPSLAYPEGGFKNFADHLGNEIKKLDGKIYLNTGVKNLEELKKDYDKIIVTLPSPVFAKIANLPKNYKKRITSIPHLHAQVLILILKAPFMDKTYWLNITEKNFPFLVLAEHTNFMDKKNYGGEHILYIGNYLPLDHPYINLSKGELLKIFMPYLKKLNPTFHFSLLTSHLFIGPFAQPVVTVDYPKKIPTFETPLKGIFLANLDMVYPWDRGTNYAIEMGKEIARIIHENRI